MKSLSNSAGRPRLPLLLSFGLLLSASLLLAQSPSPIRVDDARADDIFRQGVTRFHDGYHSEAALLHQRVLSLQPNNQLARIWLGFDYFMAGYESAAMAEWESVQKQGSASPELSSFMEGVISRRGLASVIEQDFNFFPVAQLDKENSVPYQIRRPSSVVSLPNGTSYVVSFGNNSLVVMDANGKSKRSIKGALTRMEGPFDIVLLEDELYITQMLSDKVIRYSLDGNYLSEFGSKGSGDGQFLGPQFIAWDKGTYLYVSDIGNRRVAKFDRTGKFVLFIGERSSFFAGLERPTGLVWHNNRLYVGDASRKHPALHVFDGSGNHLDTILDVRLTDIEDIGPFEKDRLLITTRNEIFEFLPQNQELRSLFVQEKARGRFVGTGMDSNGHLLASDFDGEAVNILSRLAGVYSGLTVQIHRVMADKFPEVSIELSVLDNLGNPVKGLTSSNLALTEGRKKLDNVQFLSSGSNETQLDAVIIVQADQSLGDAAVREAIQNAIRNIADGFGTGAKIALVSASDKASIEAALGSPKSQLLSAASALPIGRFWYLDQAIRLALPLLLKGQGLRHLVLVGDGRLPEDAFARYGLDENLRFLQNNRVHLSLIRTVPYEADPELSLLVKESGGIDWALYRPTGIVDLGKELLRKKDGSYFLRFKSLFDSDFGKKYLPVEVQAQLFQKSGRSESGYFAPLKM